MRVAQVGALGPERRPGWSYTCSVGAGQRGGELLGHRDRVQRRRRGSRSPARGAVTARERRPRSATRRLVGEVGQAGGQPVAHELVEPLPQVRPAGRGVAQRRPASPARPRRRPPTASPSLDRRRAARRAGPAARPARRLVEHGGQEEHQPLEPVRAVGEQPAQRAGAEADAERPGGAGQVGHRAQVAGQVGVASTARAARRSGRARGTGRRPCGRRPRCPAAGCRRCRRPSPCANTVVGAPAPVTQPLQRVRRAASRPARSAGCGSVGRPVRGARGPGPERPRAAVGRRRPAEVPHQKPLPSVRSRRPARTSSR